MLKILDQRWRKLGRWNHLFSLGCISFEMKIQDIYRQGYSFRNPFLNLGCNIHSLRHPSTAGQELECRSYGSYSREISILVGTRGNYHYQNWKDKLPDVPVGPFLYLIDTFQYIPLILHDSPLWGNRRLSFMRKAHKNKLRHKGTCQKELIEHCLAKLVFAWTHSKGRCLNRCFHSIT